MNRKKTIFIAVMINAGILAVLFITALTTQEEVTVLQSEIVENVSLPTEPLAPLFGEPVDLAAKVNAPINAPLAETLESEAPAPILQLPQAEEKAVKSEEIVVHKLPPLVRENEPPAAVSSSNSLKEIVVKKGDTLEKIARAHSTTVDAIIKQNLLPSSFLRVGQILKIPVGKTLASAPKLKPAAPKEKIAGPEYYTVKVGDNPWTIAMKHHMKVEELLRLNGLNEEKARKLKPGDRLRIR